MCNIEKIFDSKREDADDKEVGSIITIIENTEDFSSSSLDVSLHGIVDIYKDKYFWDKDDSTSEYLLFSLKDRAGCYVFYDYDGKVLYIGEAEDLFVRFAQHLTGKSDNTKLVNIKICDYLYDPNKREIVTDEKTGKKVFENYDYELFKYFYKYDVYILSVDSTFEERKLFEQILFVGFNPYHNAYSNKKNMSRCEEAKRYDNRIKSAKKRDSWLQQESKNMKMVYYTLCRSIDDHADERKF